jgi:hypothetical protein
MWVRTFDTIEELRAALIAFATRYNDTWLVARHGYRTVGMQILAGVDTEQNVTKRRLQLASSDMHLVALVNSLKTPQRGDDGEESLGAAPFRPR